MHIDLVFDASFCPKLKIGTFAFYIIAGGSRWGSANKLREVGKPDEAELMALVNALHSLKKSSVNNGTISFITIHSDCMNIFGKVNSKSKNNIAKTAMKMINEIRDKNPNVKENQNFFKMQHVKAHTGKPDQISRANEFCHNQAIIQLQLRREVIHEENTVRHQEDKEGGEAPRDLFVDSGKRPFKNKQLPVSMRG